MYAGHFAAGLALKTAVPKTKDWALFLAVGLLDVVFGILVMAGAESASGTSRDTHLYIPWSHSLLGAVLIAIAYAAGFHKEGLRVSFVLGIAVLSHWVLDAFVHAPDMGLWPMSAQQIGGRSLFGGNAGWFETVFCIIACMAYAIRAHKAQDYGRRWWAACAVIAVCYGLEIAAG